MRDKGEGRYWLAPAVAPRPDHKSFLAALVIPNLLGAWSGVCTDPVPEVPPPLASPGSPWENACVGCWPTGSEFFPAAPRSAWPDPRGTGRSLQDVQCAQDPLAASGGGQGRFPFVLTGPGVSARAGLPGEATR